MVILAHRPVWMFLRHLLPAFFQLFSFPSSERTSGCCQKDLMDLISGCSLKALEDCRMFGVYRKDLHTHFLCQRHDNMTGCNQCFLICQSNVFSCFHGSDGRRIPIMPTTAVTTISAFGSVAAAIRPSMPEKTFTSRSFTLSFSSFAFSSLHRQAISGLNSRICFSISSTLEPAARAVTLISLLYLTTSNVWFPNGTG